MTIRRTPALGLVTTIRSIVAASALLLTIAEPALRPAHAGNQIWTGTGPRAKGVQAIARDPLNSSRMWAATFGAGVYRSLDGGATWTGFRNYFVNTYVRSLAVNPHHPDSVFCGTNDGIYLSTNGGITWHEKLATTTSVRALAIHPVKTAVIYAGANGLGVYKSIDGGATWNTINLGLTNSNVRDIALHPTQPETLLAATGTGGGVHRSFNGGLFWNQVPDTTATNGAAEQIQYDRLDPNRIYVAELDRGVIRSVDGGNTWLRINLGLTSFRCRSLSVVDTLRYVGTEDAGVFYSTLNTPSWTPVSTGLLDPTVDALLASPQNPSTVWAGTKGKGIFRSDNRGGLWTQLDGGLLNTFGFSLAVRSSSSHAVYDGTGFGDQLWRSTDQGASWTRNSYLFSFNSVRAVVPDPVVAQTIYLTSYGLGVYRSTDDGATWALPDSLNATLGNAFVRDMVAWPGQSGHLYVGTDNGVYESLNGAATWVSRSGGLPASFGVRALALQPTGSGTLYAGSDSSGVYRSTDGGVSWVPKNAGLGSPFVHDIVIDATSPQIVYAGTDLGVYKSTNGGDSWLSAGTGLPAGAVRTLAQDPVHPSAVFCGVFGSGVYQSLSAGQSWQPLFNQSGLQNLNLRALAIDGGLLTIYAGTDIGVQALSNYPTAPVAIDDPAPVPSLDLAISAWPNPATAGKLQVSYSIPAPRRVRLEAFDLAGRHVRTLVDEAQGAGSHNLTWDMRNDTGRRLAAGVYFLRLHSGDSGVRIARVAVGATAAR